MLGERATLVVVTIATGTLITVCLLKGTSAGGAEERQQFLARTGRRPPTSTIHDLPDDPHPADVAENLKRLPHHPEP